MKYLVLISVILTSTVFAGGVTVGNGQGKVLVGISLRNNFQGEMDVTDFADQLIKEIRKGQFQRINKMKKDGHCADSYSQAKLLNVESFYTVKNGQLSLDREYMGYLQVELKDCKNINTISADEPFGGRDLWDL